MRKYLTLLFVAALAALTMTSCDDEGPNGGYPAPTWYPSGTWELVQDSYGMVPESQVVEYTFYRNGSGLYGYYNRYGSWVEDPMTWDAWYEPVVGSDVMYVSTPGGSIQYTYHFNGYGDLRLADYGNPGEWFIFQAL